MTKEPKGYWNNSGEKIERETPLATKTGIVLYKGRGDKWVINYPDIRQFGNVESIKLMNLIYYLGKGKNLDDARKLANLLTPDDL